jgi:hypothetical protein
MELAMDGLLLCEKMLLMARFISLFFDGNHPDFFNFEVDLMT